MCSDTSGTARPRSGCPPMSDPDFYQESIDLSEDLLDDIDEEINRRIDVTNDLSSKHGLRAGQMIAVLDSLHLARMSASLDIGGSHQDRIETLVNILKQNARVQTGEDWMRDWLDRVREESDLENHERVKTSDSFDYIR